MWSSGALLQDALFLERDDLSARKVPPSPLTTNCQPAIGDLFEQFELKEVLGEGASGIVYRAWDHRLARHVALKVFKCERHSDKAVRRRLLREARAISRLNHPGFCTIYDLGEDQGRAYIVMEYVQGRLLRNLAAKGLTKEQVMVYGAQLASALSHAHQRGVIHRDVKSTNIIVKPNGVVKLLDFGLALRLPKGSINKEASASASQYEAAKGGGTLSYSAPEILRGERASVQSDLWALGVVLYEMTGGRLPFTGRTPFETALGIMTKSPPPLPRGRDPHLPAVIFRCLEKDCAHRYAAAQEVYDDLHSALLAPPVLPPTKRLLGFRSAGAA
ncbi:MAG: serine/threonine-protein kinase [Terriglobia bacterium]